MTEDLLRSVALSALSVISRNSSFLFTTGLDVKDIRAQSSDFRDMESKAASEGSVASAGYRPVDRYAVAP